MLGSDTLTKNDHFVPDAINAASPSAAEWTSAFEQATQASHRAALCVIAGHKHIADSHRVLLTQLENDGLLGKAIAWALGHVATDNNGIEAALLAAIADGSLDVRENGYSALAVIAARDCASGNLATAMAERVNAEIERARNGGTGLGEQACRVLAILGAPQTIELIQRVISEDRYCDRFELQRLRKSVTDNGRDHDSIKLLKADWSEFFSDYLAAEQTPEATPNAAPKDKRTESPIDAPHTSSTPPHNGPNGAISDDDQAGLEDPDGNGEEDGGAIPLPIDWESFKTSEEMAALPEKLRQLAGQLGPLLEQLAIRAVRAQLSDLNGQEFVALLLQVLPQALPPQHVQMALSPEALICYKAIIKFLIRTGVATNGEELLNGLKMVREALIAQIRQAGILNGPDYSDPDEKGDGKQPAQPVSK